MVLIRDGKVLIGRRPEGVLLGGLWEFAGGKLEAGETLDGCRGRSLRNWRGESTWMGRLDRQIARLLQPRSFGEGQGATCRLRCTMYIPTSTTAPPSACKGCSGSPNKGPASKPVSTG